MRTVLVCVRTPLAAQSIASCAARLGAGAVLTATSEAEAMARLGEQPAELILADTAVTRPDPVGFTRRVLARAPRALLLLFGNEDPQVATAVMAAGARGLIRGVDQDPVVAVVKALLLIGTPRRAAAPPPVGLRGAGAPPVSGPPLPGAAPRPAEPEAEFGRPAPARPGRLPAPPPAGAVRPPAAAAPEGTAGPQPRPGPPATAPGPAGAGLGAVTGAAGMPRPVPFQRGDATVEGNPVPARRLTLTERELQVLRGMSDGKSNAEIGRDLYVSEDTVKTHARRLFRKLGVRDRAHAVAVGFRSGALA